jgi:hypothetical protein
MLILLLKAMHFIALYSRHWDWNVVFQTSHCVAYGKDSKPCFEIYVGKKKSSSLHIALASSSQESVDNFYKKALSLGAQDNGLPGYRDYFPGYYAAFIIDPNGHNLEALFWDSVKTLP